MRSATEATGLEIPHEQVRGALEKILASAGFVNAERLSRFLRYVVESTLDGQADRLKETLVGIEVFGRKPTYDPRIDAVVRTEAVKLRARLSAYYEGDGRQDAVRIDLPKGGYVPAFRPRETEVLVAGPAAEELIPASEAPWRWRLAAVSLGIVLATFAGLFFVKRVNRAERRAAELSSIAVLPFADLSSARDQEYFCDGMTEEIIDALAKVGGFRVVARTSSFAFKGKQQDIREIGRQLNVDAVLEGSVRKFGDKLRVTAQLNSVADGYHLWSETYERELKDVFKVQDEISQAIVRTLQVKLANREQVGKTNSSAISVNPLGLSGNNPADLEAYDLYLKGRFHWSRWRTDGAQKAIGYFEQAIARDSTYAPAYAGLADSYCWLGFFGALPPREAMGKAKRAALRAIELDDSSAQAHTSLGFVLALSDFDWHGAEREFRRAIELNPGLAEAHFGYSMGFLAPKGRTAEAIAEMKLARDLDPLALSTNTYLGVAYDFAGRPEEAIAQFEKTLELDPTFFEARAHLAQAYCARRDMERARAELAKVRGEPSGSRVGLSLAMVDAMLGDREAALAAVKKWEHPPAGVYVRATTVANVYAALGDGDSMMRWLERAYDERDGMLAYTCRGAIYDRFRGDARLRALMDRIGLPMN